MKAFSSPWLQSKWVIHLFIWLFILIVPHLFISTSIGESNEFFMHFYLKLILYGVGFYIVYLWLVPHFFLRNKKILFFVISFAAFFMLYQIEGFAIRYVLPEDQFRNMMVELSKLMEEKGYTLRPPSDGLRLSGFIAISVLLMGSALGLRLSEELTKKEKQQKELEKQHLTSTLEMLRNQVSPHFFFNTLNNIYALTTIDPKLSGEAVLKLSRLMRYLLYESAGERVELTKEVAFLNNYIDLMKLRMSENVDIEIDFPAIPESYQIAPLLFIPFIENAFKHGVSNREHSFIRIHLNIDDEKVVFECENSAFKSFTEKDQVGGIGLVNVKKRLDLLFPKSHQLEIEDKTTLFRVHLIINQKQN